MRDGSYTSARNGLAAERNGLAAERAKKLITICTNSRTTTSTDTDCAVTLKVVEGDIE